MIRAPKTRNRRSSGMIIVLLAGCVLCCCRGIDHIAAGLSDSGQYVIRQCRRVDVTYVPSSSCIAALLSGQREAEVGRHSPRSVVT